MMKQKMSKQVVMYDIAEGDRIYQQMKQAMLSVKPNIGSTVSMNYALSKLIANYQLMMKILDIDVNDYIGNMVAFWEHQLQHNLNDEQLDFDGFAYMVERNMEALCRQ